MTQVNVNIDELKRMATLIANEQAKFQNGNNIGKHNSQHVKASSPPSSRAPQKVVENAPKAEQRQKAKVESGNSSEDIANIIPVNSEGNDQATTGDTSIQVATPGDNMFDVLGFAIPKQTLYFLLILIVIAVIIWYMSKDTKSNKKKKHHEDDE
jgi:hypothetical protein